MRRAAKNDTRGTIFRLFTILWSHLHEEKHVGSLIAKRRFGRSPLTTVHHCRYACWTLDFFLSKNSTIPSAIVGLCVKFRNHLSRKKFHG
ncbi:hypothetical protein JTE90_017321 [Oedothorax gibbosus]|uniref:Uncharacterized protein n=1 Tax=Oedothorax gibbosus TaxID=931172 RepID=A0AAV6UD52_9ARAC|nr:hypothetical protein JTE90_017321 [Oedothorax gibbosus]